MSDQNQPSYDTCSSVSEFCPVEATTYGYYPNLGVNIFFTIFFGICVLIQLAFTLRTRTWTYAIGLGIGTILETAGYAGRVVMHYNPWNSGGFQLQIICLILAPSFIAASLYLTLKHLVTYYGPEHSRLKPRLYPWIFVGCDFGSIALQAIGGGIAAAAGDGGSIMLLNTGNNLIVAGIAFQVGTMVICGALVVDYLVRLRRAGGISLRTVKNVDGNDSSQESHTESEGEKSRAVSSTRKATLPKINIFWMALGFAYITILIRCIYRLPEMVGGWGNPRMRNEKEFLVLDGMMVALAVLALSTIHPGYFFPPMQKTRKPKTTTTAAGTTPTTNSATDNITDKEINSSSSNVV